MLAKLGDRKAVPLMGWLCTCLPVHRPRIRLDTPRGRYMDMTESNQFTSDVDDDSLGHIFEELDSLGKHHLFSAMQVSRRWKVRPCLIHGWSG
jgi:hypothetical protein